MQPTVILLSITFFLLAGSGLTAQKNVNITDGQIRFRDGSSTRAMIDLTGGELSLSNSDASDGDIYITALKNAYLQASGINLESNFLNLTSKTSNITLGSATNIIFKTKVAPSNTFAATRMVINNLGKIGMNISNPSNLLHLYALEGAQQLQLEDGSGYFELYGGEIFQINDQDDIRFLIEGAGRPNAGHVGIGVTAPQRKLHLFANPSAPQLRLQDFNGFFDLYAGADFLVQNGAGTHLFIKGTGGNTGNIGLGTTNPQRKMHLVTTASPQLRLQDAGGFVELYGGADFVFRNATGGNLMVLQNSGRMFAAGLANIGDFRNLQYNDVTGEIGYDNSSRRDKRRIQDLKDNFSALLDITPKTYTRPWAPDRWEIGFIAEDFHDKGLHRLVEYDQEGQPDGLRYDKMVTYLVPLLKQQQETMEEQEGKVEALEKEVADLRRELAAIRQMILRDRTGVDRTPVDTEEHAPAETGAHLEQNAPNPFTENTLIRYLIPRHYQQAEIDIIDTNGRIIRRFPISTTGEGNIQLEGSSLPEGVYFYQLILDGHLVDTKKMVLTKR